MKILQNNNYGLVPFTIVHLFVVNERMIKMIIDFHTHMFPDKIAVKYVDYPWISCFEVEGIEILKTEADEERLEAQPVDNGFLFGDFDDILYSSDNESPNESGGNEDVSNFKQSFGICQRLFGRKQYV